MLEAVAGDCELVGLEVTAFEAPDDDEERQAAAAVAAHVLEPLLEAIPEGATSCRLQRLTRPKPRPSPQLRPLVEDLHARREKAKLGGGAEKIERQHSQDKLTARERLALLVDDGTFTELGIHAGPHFSAREHGGQGGAGRRRRHRLRQGRRPAWSRSARTTSR